MKCPSCSCEVLPVRETSSLVGGSVKHPDFCGACGAALTEKCPICLLSHPIGTKFCAAKGTDIEAWVREENAWKQLVQSLEATLTVRPAKALVAVVLCGLPALYFVGGAFLRVVIADWNRSGFYYHDVPHLVIGSILMVAVTAVLTGVSMLIPIGIIQEIEKARREDEFEKQGYRVYTFPE